MSEEIVSIFKESKKREVEVEKGKRKVMLDLTFGLGGHSLRMLKEDDDLEVVGIELDKRILDYFHKEYMPNYSDYQ